MEKIDSLLTHPEQCAPDKYKLNNDGSFRAFELHRLRVSYRYTGREIRIVRVRHTRMNPKNH
ncbi:type II toxin-antitoxin system RelE/ParE family toxin [Chitinophaga alhagiae]|uniref:type II toxin-antitoxin system RelE/ParE family toxin n=1 Tax=Chitinophaga alhagiae TaxID=2203219 RepID=UPI000E5A809D